MLGKILSILKGFFKRKSAILSYEELVELVEMGVIDAPIENINGASIDLTLHHIIRKEVIGSAMKTVRLWDGESIDTEEINMLDGHDCYRMMPDSVILGATVERFNMPLNLSAQYSLKSTMGRNFLGHELAGFVDPGFNGTLTLELKNNNQFHKLEIAPDMKIGQVVFMRNRPVPEDKSYRVRGQYNGQDKATGSKGIK